MERKRLRSVRLSDVPLELRQLAGWKLIDRASREGRLMEAVRLREAVLSPSERRYFLPADAVDAVLAPERL